MCILVGLLQEYQDVFAFGPEEMLDVNPTMIEHWVNIWTVPTSRWSRRKDT